MSTLLCNAPFCQNTRNYNHAWCGEHRWDREKYKIKPYKELLPYWCLKRCDLHGYLKPNKVYINPANKSKLCIQCTKDNAPPYDPIKQKFYNDRYPEKRKNMRLQKRYKISIDDYQKLLIKQNSKCALCEISIKEHQKRKGTNHWFAVDHCHVSGKIRGLLCFKCNMGLGYFNDDLSLLETALKYLRSYE